MTTGLRVGPGDLERILTDATRLEQFEESTSHPAPPRVTPAQLLEFLEIFTGDAFDVSPEQAISYFQAKGLKPTFSYADMLGEAHDQAFTVAKMMDLDLLAHVRKSLDDALTSGESFNAWKSKLQPMLQKAGWWGEADMLDPLTGNVVPAQLGSPWRLETIFRTNMQTAYAVGQWDEIESQAAIAPFLMYDAVDDHRTRPEHAKWDRTVLPVSHQWWRTHFPPNGWNCRCSVIQLDETEVEALGLQVGKSAPADGTYTWKNPRTGRTSQIPDGIDPGFNRNPGRQHQENLNKLLVEKIGALPEDMGIVAKRALAPILDRETAAKLAAEAKEAAAQKVAQESIDKALQAETPYLSAAIKAVQKTKAGAGMKPTELLQAATDKAAKAEQSAALANYKQSVLAGKEPSAKAKQAFAALDPDDQAKITAQIAQQAAVQAAQEAIDKLAAGQGHLTQKAALKQLQASGTAAELGPVQLLAEVDKLANQMQAKATATAAVNAYKKNAIAGKIPTPLQKQAFDALPDDKKAQLLDEIDKAKAPPPTQQTPSENPAIAKPPAALNPDTLTQIGPQKGSNPGGLYQDTETGTKWYIKQPADVEAARNEVLAAKLYELAGIEVPELHLTQMGGKTSVASKIIDGLAKGATNELAKAADGFAVDAWLGNWDVVGMDFDNLLLRAGVPVRVDTGGALRYRAQGGLKGSAFGNKVNEIDTLRDAKKNPKAAAVFGNMTPAQLEVSVARVLAIDDKDIRALVDQHGPIDAAERTKLADILIARKADLAQRFPNATQVSAKALAQAVEVAEFAAREGLAEVNGSILTAIKGIASRAGKGTTLEAKDLQRVADARKAWTSWLAEHSGVLTADAVRDAQAYYAAWLDDLDIAVSGGAGSPAKWAGGQFDGFSSPLRVDRSRVKVQFPTGGMTFSPKEAKTVIEKALGSSAASINVPKGTGYEAFKEVPLEHQRAVSLYTGSHYRALNEALRENAASPAQLRYAELLNEALSLAPKYQGKVTRGMQLDGSRLDRYLERARNSMLEGQPFLRQAFTSTSKGDRAAFGGNVVEHIQSRAGVHVKPISLHPSENEVLLKGNTRFQVTKVEQTGGIWHVYMEEIDG